MYCNLLRSTIYHFSLRYTLFRSTIICAFFLK